MKLGLKFNTLSVLCLIFLSFILLSNNKAAALPGEATNFLNNQIVSYINATCQTDPLNCAGSYHSDSSFSLLYVPTGLPTAAVVIDQISSGGYIGGFSIRPLTTSPDYQCATGVENIVQIPRAGLSRPPQNNDKLEFPNSGFAGIRQITNGANNVTYNIYCVQVTTGPNHYPASENVQHRLYTDGFSLLGAFSGPQTNLGTGYFGGNGQSYRPPNNTNWWSQAVAFSAPCTVDGNQAQGSASMTLYDLDTYAGVNKSMQVSVTKTLKADVTAPDAGVYGVSYNIYLNGNITQLGGNVYRVNELASGASLTITPQGEPYYSEYQYSVLISNIGSANKIRIRLPYDQINSVITCKSPPDPLPVCTLSNAAIASGIKISWTSKDATRIDINQGVGSSLTPVAAGSKDVAFFPSRTYTATVTGPGGSGTCTTVTAAEPPPPVGVNCPSYPPNALNFNTVQRVNLPRSVPGGPGHDINPWVYSSSGPASGPSYGGTSFGSTTTTATTETRQISRTVTYTRVLTYTQIYRYPTSPALTVVDSVVDEWGETLAVPLLRRSGNDHYIFLDYKKHFDNYPYDLHSPKISYRIGYELKQRIGTYTQYYTATQYGTSTRTRADSASAWSGYTYNWGGVPGANFSSPPSIGSATIVNNDNFSYSGRRDVSNPILWSGSLPTLSAPIMPPCYPRDYDATPTTSGATLTPNRESPTQSTLTFTIPTKLSFSKGGGLRTATTVTGLKYTVEYKAEGYSNPSYSGSFNRTVNITNTSLSNNVNGRAGASGTLSENVAVNVPSNIKAGDRICWKVTVGQPTGTVKKGGEIWQPGGTARTSEACTLTAIDQPYTRFYGGDVFAGGGFDTNAGIGTCTAANPNAKASGPMRADILAGSGAQLAVFAIKAIEGIQPLSRTTRTPTELAFSNASSNVGGRQFGGNFGSLSCAHNYFNDIPSNANWDTSTANVNLATLSSGRHYYEGNINLSGKIPDGNRVVVYVKGDVLIKDPSGKVGFANNVQWGTIDLIPSLYLISNGKINVDYKISELDGSYISQGSEINTCTVDGTFPIDQPTISQRTIECRTQLRVNGAFLANKVNLLRTLGSLRESVALEAPSSTRAAETFIYNPTFWLTRGGNLPSNTKIQIDSYISLPPSL